MCRPPCSVVVFGPVAEAASCSGESSTPKTLAVCTSTLGDEVDVEGCFFKFCITDFQIPERVRQDDIAPIRANAQGQFIGRAVQIEIVFIRKGQRDLESIAA